jgi:hypothetical protein
LLFGGNGDYGRRAGAEHSSIGQPLKLGPPFKRAGACGLNVITRHAGGFTDTEVACINLGCRGRVPIVQGFHGSNSLDATYCLLSFSNFFDALK